MRKFLNCDWLREMQFLCNTVQKKGNLVQFRAKTAMAGVRSKFAFATETTVEELKNCSKNENTAKSTGFWLSVWTNWCVDKEIMSRLSLTLCSRISTPK